MNIRQLHKKVSLVIFLPLLAIALSGLLLQLRNQFEWIQPETVSAASVGEVMGYRDLLSALKVDESQVEQVIYRPKKRMSQSDSFLAWRSRPIR